MKLIWEHQTQAEYGFESQFWHLCPWATHLIASLQPGVNGYLLWQRWVQGEVLWDALRVYKVLYKNRFIIIIILLLLLLLR